MDCENCGSPLDVAGQTCAFCGTRSSALPATEVPITHQRGAGRELSKTYDDSLAAIKSGLEYSAQVHEGEVRRSKIFLPILMMLLASPMLFLAYLWIESRPVPIDYEACVVSGLAAVSQGDYPSGTALLAQAVFERHESAEPHILLGAAFYAELLQKPLLDPRIRDKRIYGVFREMTFALQADPDDPRAQFFLGLHHYEKGEIPKAVDKLEACLAHLSKIPEQAQRQQYSEVTTALLQKLRSPTQGPLILYSEIDGSQTKHDHPGIEVPFGR